VLLAPLLFGVVYGRFEFDLLLILISVRFLFHLFIDVTCGSFTLEKFI